MRQPGVSPDNTPCVYQFSLSLGTLYLNQQDAGNLTSAGPGGWPSWAETCPARQVTQASESLFSREDAGCCQGEWIMARSAGAGVQSQWSLALRTELPAAKSLACLALLLHILWRRESTWRLGDSLQELVLYPRGVLEIRLRFGGLYVLSPLTGPRFSF